MRSFYKGFSTRYYEGVGAHLFDMYDIKLVEEDLMNELFTIIGERLHMPEFGTRIPLLLFEPGDTETAEILEEDVRKVIDRDPRVALEALSIITPNDKNTLIAVAKIRYLEFNVVQDLNIEVGSR